MFIWFICFVRSSGSFSNPLLVDNFEHGHLNHHVNYPILALPVRCGGPPLVKNMLFMVNTPSPKMVHACPPPPFIPSFRWPKLSRGLDFITRKCAASVHFRRRMSSQTTHGANSNLMEGRLYGGRGRSEGHGPKVANPRSSKSGR